MSGHSPNRKLNPDPPFGVRVTLPESVWAAIDAARTDDQNRQDWIREAVTAALKGQVAA